MPRSTDSPAYAAARVFKRAAHLVVGSAMSLEFLCPRVAARDARDVGSTPSALPFERRADAADAWKPSSDKFQKSKRQSFQPINCANRQFSRARLVNRRAHLLPGKLEFWRFAQRVGVHSVEARASSPLGGSFISCAHGVKQCFVYKAERTGGRIRPLA